MDRELYEYYINEIQRIENNKRITGFKYKQDPFVRDIRIKRNEKCPCGSGLKYKRCCMLKEG